MKPLILTEAKYSHLIVASFRISMDKLGKDMTDIRLQFMDPWPEALKSPWSRSGDIPNELKRIIAWNQ